MNEIPRFARDDTALFIGGEEVGDLPIKTVNINT